MILMGLISLMVGLAWLLLGFWSVAPAGRYVEGAQGSVGMGWLLLHLGVWVLMCAAMMLPTTLPLLVIWQRLVSRHRDRLLLQALVIAGYLGAWTVFGLGFYGVDAGLHQGWQTLAWAEANPGLLGAATLAIAGSFQFSPLKHHCLDQCRSPLGFALAAWQGQPLRWQAWRLGVRHGLYCVGCCWALMLLMVIVGMGNLGWMLGLAAVMAVEKTAPWGDRLSKPLGMALLVGAIAVALADIYRVV